MKYKISKLKGSRGHNNQTRLEVFSFFIYSTILFTSIVDSCDGSIYLVSFLSGFYSYFFCFKVFIMIDFPEYFLNNLCLFFCRCSPKD